MLIGSCFSENIGGRLFQAGFDVLANPLGIVYNAVSLSEQLGRMIDGATFAEEDVRTHPSGELHSIFDLHSAFSSTDPKDVLRKANEAIATGRDHLLQSDWVVITLGTSFAFKLWETDRVVANCHKFPADFFKKKRLSFDDQCSALNEAVHKIRAINPKVSFIWTVSPVRHTREGLVQNSWSKALLIQVCHELCDRTGGYYFPSYEMLIDDLRDYRFYKEDLIHPSTTAVDYIWEKFGACFFSNDTLTINEEIEKILRDRAHKPLNPSSDAYTKHILRTREKEQEFKLKFPHIRLDDLLSSLK